MSPFDQFLQFYQPDQPIAQALSLVPILCLGLMLAIGKSSNTKSTAWFIWLGVIGGIGALAVLIAQALLTAR
jgi:hypothetical protein